MNLSHRKSEAEKEAFARAHLGDALERVTAPLPDARGKVRDLFWRGEELFIVATDRVSAFDVVLGTVPFKGALLTEQSAVWLERAVDVIPTHLLERVDPQVMRVRRATPLPVEIVVRGYLAGSLAREPAETRGQAYGLSLPPDLLPHQKLEAPIVTPTTKAEMGEHDLAISPADIVAQGLTSERDLTLATEAALALFALGTAHAADAGLILVDTKYEFGKIGDEIVLIDEIHTADSSRFWEQATYAERLARGEAPHMLDKERLRRWLREAHGYAGDGPAPALSDDIRVDLAVHYWDLTERVLGGAVTPPEGDAAERVEGALVRALVAS